MVMYKYITVQGVQSLDNAVLWIVISESLDNFTKDLRYRKMTMRAILQRNYGKMTISWSFSYNYVVKFHG